jgi:hypothetical protein
MEAGLSFVIKSINKLCCRHNLLCHCGAAQPPMQSPNQPGDCFTAFGGSQQHITFWFSNSWLQITMNKLSRDPTLCKLCKRRHFERNAVKSKSAFVSILRLRSKERCSAQGASLMENKM